MSDMIQVMLKIILFLVF